MSCKHFTFQCSERLASSQLFIAGRVPGKETEMEFSMKGVVPLRSASVSGREWNHEEAVVQVNENPMSDDWPGAEARVRTQIPALGRAQLQASSRESILKKAMAQER